MHGLSTIKHMNRPKKNPKPLTKETIAMIDAWLKEQGKNNE